MRAQTSLPALGIAVLLLTAGLVATLTAAGSAFDAAERPALDRHAAVGLSDRLVADRSSVTVRANVVNASKLSTLDPETLRDAYGLSDDADARVRMGQQTLVEAGNPADGVTIERLVLLQRRQRRTLVPPFRWGHRVSLPRRTHRVDLSIQPPANTTVRTVRIDGRVRLHDTSGLRGSFEIPVSTRQTPTVRFDVLGSLSAGDVRITYYPATTEKTRLEVTVDG